MRSAEEFGWSRGTVVQKNGIFEFEPDEIVVDEEIEWDDLSWRAAFVLALFFSGVAVYLFNIGWGAAYVFGAVFVSVVVGTKLQLYLDKK